MAPICPRCKLEANGEGLPTCYLCKGSFHFVCSLKEASWRKYGADKRALWRCQECRNDKGDNEEEQSENDTYTQNPVVATDIDIDPKKINSIEDIREQLSKLVICFNTLTDNYKFQSDKFDCLIKTVADQETKIKQQQKDLAIQDERIQGLQAEKTALRKELGDMRKNLVEMEQYGRRQNLEIHGIQERHNEKLENIVLDVAKKLKIPCSSADIDVVHRIPTVMENKRKPILVRFTTRKTHAAWLEHRKTGLVSNNLVSGSDDQDVYINANLSPYLKNLFWKTRIAAKQLKFKSCWASPSGQIFMQQTEQSARIRILSEADLPPRPPLRLSRPHPVPQL